MTDRFSNDYIKFILSDEVLQRGHVWGNGDWFVHRETKQIGLLAMDPDDEIMFVKEEAIDWLPTLSDLLGMIEGAGCKYRLGSSGGGGYIAVAVKDEPKTPIYSARAEDEQLAAAKLAVRAVEEKCQSSSETK